MTTTVRRRWLVALTTIIAAQYAVVGLAAQGGERSAGLLGAAAILGSLALAGRSRTAAATLLVLGALPLALLTWWSIATPVLAVACLTLGWPRTRPSRVAIAAIP